MPSHQVAASSRLLSFQYLQLLIALMVMLTGQCTCRYLDNGVRHNYYYSMSNNGRSLMPNRGYNIAPMIADADSFGAGDPAEDSSEDLYDDSDGLAMMDDGLVGKRDFLGGSPSAALSSYQPPPYAGFYGGIHSVGGGPYYTGGVSHDAPYVHGGLSLLSKRK